MVRRFKNEGAGRGSVLLKESPIGQLPLQKWRVLEWNGDAFTRLPALVAVFVER